MTPLELKRGGREERPPGGFTTGITRQWGHRRKESGLTGIEPGNQFAKYCDANRCCRITFNYDDFLDEAPAQTGSWNPYWGYGFFCPSSLDTIASFDELETNSDLRLLKPHGSINWRPKLGYASPDAIDSISHHYDWSGVSLRYPQVCDTSSPNR